MAQTGEQYRGWQQLPPTGGQAAPMNPTAAAEVLRTEGVTISVGSILQFSENAREAVRVAMLRAHPDKGGTSERFMKVQQARAVLANFHGVAI